MGVGQSGKKKVGAIIQARMGSTRLPGKVVMSMPFNSEHTIISLIVDRLRQSHAIDQIILATTTKEEDGILVKEAERLDIDFFRGSENNVLERFADAATQFNLDVVIRFTGDNPIVFPEIIDEVIDAHICGEYEYSRNSNLPYGTSFEVINAAILTEILNKSPSSEESEHVTLFIKNHFDEYKIQQIEHPYALIDLRLTVDNPKDYALMNIVLSYLLSMDKNYSVNDVLGFFVKYPWLKSVNN